MDATQFSEGDYITAALVKASPTKKAIILGDGVKEEVTFSGKTSSKLTMPVEIDGKKKVYRPNVDSVKNIIGSLGAETKAWLGRTLNFTVISTMGKESVIATVQK